MSRLIVIRHSQASFGKEDYDQISPLGHEQSVLLGEYLANTNIAFDHVYVGPLKRHNQTFEGVKGVFETKNKPFPTPVFLDELAEHHGPQVLRAALPELMDRDEEIKEWVELGTSSPAEKKKMHLKVFEKVMLEWAQGRLDSNRYNLQPWMKFRAMVQKGILHIVENTPNGKTVVVFTSGGTISAMLGYTLGLNNVKTMELNPMVINSSISEFLFTNDKFSLKQFNAIPHLSEDRFITYV